MNTNQLSNRLRTVAQYIPKGSKIADIGSDHAYLPCYAVKQGIAEEAIAGEVVEGPFQSALAQVKADKLEDKISVRKGSGLSVLTDDEVDVITIAGMGGTLIASILEEGSNRLGGVKRLILQPNISSISIRLWLRENGWALINEEIIEEDEKIYEILIAEKGDINRGYGDLEEGLLLGPYLLLEKSAVFIKKWKHERKNWERIISQIQAAKSSNENNEKIVALQKKIAIVGGVLS